MPSLFGWVRKNLVVVPPYVRLDGTHVSGYSYRTGNITSPEGKFIKRKSPKVDSRQLRRAKVRGERKSQKHAFERGIAGWTKVKDLFRIGKKEPHPGVDLSLEEYLVVNRLEKQWISGNTGNTRAVARKTRQQRSVLGAAEYLTGSGPQTPSQKQTFDVDMNTLLDIIQRSPKTRTYRGLTVTQDILNLFSEMGNEYDEDLATSTGRRGLAAMFSMDAFGTSEVDDVPRMLLLTIDGRNLPINSHSTTDPIRFPIVYAADERFISGRFRVTEPARENPDVPGLWEATVEQVGE